MSKPTRPEVLPTESSILAARDWRGRDGEPCDHPGCLSHISHPCEGCGRIGGLPPGLRLHLQMGRDLSHARHENRVRGECLEIAMKALDWYGHNCSVLLCGKAGQVLAQIEQRLAQLEPEEETG